MPLPNRLFFRHLCALTPSTSRLPLLLVLPPPMRAWAYVLGCGVRRYVTEAAKRMSFSPRWAAVALLAMTLTILVGIVAFVATWSGVSAEKQGQLPQPTPRWKGTSLRAAI